VTPDPERVFISYRRADGGFVARAVSQFLDARGWDVFLDVDDVDSGRFENVILNELGARPHYVIVVTPTVFGRPSDQPDWVRREIERAFELGKNVIPLFIEGVAVNDIPVDDPVLGRLKEVNALVVPHQYFDEAMERLVNRFLRQPTLQELQVKTAEEHYTSGRDALDREDWGKAESELSEAIRLNPRDPSYFQNRAIVRTAREDYSAALDDIEQALALDPTSVQLATDKANLLSSMDRVDEALAWFRAWGIRTGNWEHDLDV
jgi:hypothetical protein